MENRQIFNVRTQALEEVELSVDDNNEIVATFSDKTFVKFPAGLSEKEFESLIDEHERANTGQEIVTLESLEAASRVRAASLALIGKSPEGNKTNVPDSND